MNKLKQLITYLSIHWKQSLLVCIIATVLITYTIQLLTPPLADPAVESTLVTQNFDTTTSDLSNISFSGNELATPDTVKIVKTSPTTNTTAVADTVIAKLNLQPTEADVWENDSWKLLYVSNPGYYELMNKQTTDSLKTADKTKAIQLAQDFISNTLQMENISPIPQSVVFFSGLLELKTTNEFKANIISIPFAYTVDSFPVYINRESVLPVSVMVNSEDVITKVTFKPLPFSFVSIENAKPISVEQALENMNDKNIGAFITAYKPEFSSVNLTESISGTLNSVTFEYRYDQASQTIYPFYRFSGTLTENQGTPFDAELITPAM